jgi:hypothetical protein
MLLADDMLFQSALLATMTAISGWTANRPVK